MNRHHPVFYPVLVFYPILVFLLMDGSVADMSTSCKQFSNPEVETTIFTENGCFLLSQVERTWNESKTFCEDLGNGWSLVVINDTELQKHVDNLTSGVSPESWIGLRQYDRYRWVSGDKLKFPDFFQNELGESEVQTQENCVTTSPPDEALGYGTWNNRNCKRRFSTMCHTNAVIGSRGTTTTTTTTTTTSTTTTTTTTTTTSTTITAAKEDTSVKANATRNTGATQAVTTSVETSMERAKTTTSPSTTATTLTVQIRPLTDSTSATTSVPTVDTTSLIIPAGIVVPVSTGAAVVAAVAVVGVVIILCRRKKAKRRRARPIDAHGDDDGEAGDVRTNPDVVYAVVDPGSKRQTSQAPSSNPDPGYDYIPVDDEDSVNQRVTDQMYHTTTTAQEKQQITLDNTYDRATFRQSEDEVYDTTTAQEKQQSSLDNTYDRATFRQSEDEVYDTTTAPEKQQRSLDNTYDRATFRQSEDEVYDTTTAQEKQQSTLDNTYDRATFRQSGDEVYHHACLTRKSPPAQDASHYDHAVVK